MDIGDAGSDNGEHKPRAIPTNLPTSLDDRRHAPVEDYVRETEMYDGWQGRCPGPPSSRRPVAGDAATRNFPGLLPLQVNPSS